MAQSHTTAAQQTPIGRGRDLWVINPAADLTCMSAGWLLFYFVPYILPQYFEAIRMFSVAFLFASHRYFTFLLVYLDRVEFARRRVLYVTTPLACFAFVGLCYYFRVDEPEMYAVWYLFNFFHFVRQKYGILRIYSGKARWGHKRLDELTTYTWSAAGIVHLYTNLANIKVMHYLRDLIGYTPPVETATVLFAAAATLTVPWLVYEFRSPSGPSVPKMLFMASTVFLYGIGPTLSAGAIYVATSINHASEYIALVALTIRNKARHHASDAPVLSQLARHVVRNTLAIVVVLCVLHYFTESSSTSFFLFIAYGTSFAHFVLDGFIWKLRRPRVAQEVGAATG